MRTAHRLVLADHHPVVLEGLTAVFNTEPGIRVLAQCTTAQDTLDVVFRDHPEVLLLDVHLPGLGAFGILRELARAQSVTRPILLCAALRHAEAVEAIRLGARGILLKDLAPCLLIDCVRKVCAGERWIEPRFRQVLADGPGPRGPSTDDPLTTREREIVFMVTQGLRNREIGVRLDIAEGTVKMHLHNIYRKLKIESRVQLAFEQRDRSGATHAA